MENLLVDVRYALRVIRKSPAFTVVALLTLMLRIGANVVVFRVSNHAIKPFAPVRQGSQSQVIGSTL
jgi:hypothetical protein